MIITDEFNWDYLTFESYVEGLRKMIRHHPFPIVAFKADLTPLSVLTLFAIWKEGKIACPLNPKIPDLTPFLHRVSSPLFTPIFPRPLSPSVEAWDVENKATYLFTSGSTGIPKIACHRLKHHLNHAKGSATLIDLSEKSVWAASLPLFHVGGLAILFRCYLAKAKIIFSSSLQQATHASFVPTQLYRLIKDQIPLSHLSVILLGGAPLPAFDTCAPIFPTYGMTEMSSQIVTNHILHPYAHMNIKPDHSIWVKGSVLFEGYLEKDSHIHLPVDQDGWFETKDLGYWSEGKFMIIGRKDNQFICGGENIQPEEIERLIHLDDPEQQAVIIPLADQEYGSRPAVYLKYPENFLSIQAKLKNILPSFKIPIQAFQLPATEGLKPNRKRLIQQANIQY